MMARVREANWRQWLVAAALVLFFLLPIPHLMATHATSMEEGSIVQYATMTAHGSVPTKDYWTEYGPLNVYTPAAAFALFGPSVTLERVIGIGYRLLVLGGLFVLLRRQSRRAAWTGTLLSWWMLSPWGIMAYSWIGGLGCALWALAFATDASPEHRPRRLFLAGLFATLALGFRPDLVLALGVAGVIALWPQRRSWRPLVLGAGVGLLPYLGLVVTAGVGNVVRDLVIDPLVHLRAGRALPVPPNMHWTGEFFSRVQQYVDTLTNHTWYGAPLSTEIAELFWLLVLVGVVMVVAAVYAWRDRHRSLLTLVVFALLLTTNILQRADISHMRLVGTLWLALVPLVTSVAVRHWFPRAERVMLVSSVGLVVLAALVAPALMIGNFTDLIGGRSDFAAPRNVLTFDGRSVQAENSIEAYTMAEAAVQVRDHSHPGERFFEGPSDLRFANYNEPIFYWLESQLHPASTYLEVNPGITNTPHSGLAADVASADIVLLSNRYAHFSEPNTSTVPGFAGPNLVIERQFCLVWHNAWYDVLRKRTTSGVPRRDAIVRLGVLGVPRCSAPGVSPQP